MTAGTLELHELAKTVRRVHGEMLLDDRFDEPLDFRVKPNFNTACWSFDAPRHSIFIGTSLFERAKAGLTPPELSKYVGRYAHHERAHAMYTERDNKLTLKQLAERKVPFGLYNLTEDARIEARYVAESDGTFRFEWLAYETLQANCLLGVGAAVDAGNVLTCAFFNCIQSEGDFDAVRARYPAHWSAVLDDAEGFYREAVGSENSLGAIDVAKAMLDKYPGLSNTPSRCSSLETGAAMQGSKGKKLRDKFQSESLTPAEAETQAAGGAPKGEESVPGKKKPYEGENLLAKAPERALDMARVERLAQVLLRMSVPKTSTRMAGSTPTARVSLRHILAGEAKWVGPSPPALKSLPRKLLLVIDCSGSMKGEPLEAACYLLAALSVLAKSLAISGSCVLSTTNHFGSAGRFMSMPLPWKVADIEKVKSHDGEGLADNLGANDSLIETADFTLVVTDGNIGGPALDHRRYARRKKRVVGAYVRNQEMPIEDIAEAMSSHFERFLIRDSVERLTDAIVSQPF